MLSSFLSAITTSSGHVPPNDTPKSPVTQVTHDFDLLQLETPIIPGSFSAPITHFRSTSPAMSEITESQAPSIRSPSPAASEYTDSPRPSNSESVGATASDIAGQLDSLHLENAIPGSALPPLATAKKSSSAPAFRPGRQFGRMENPQYSRLAQHNKSPPAAGGVTKRESDELKRLDLLGDDLDRHHAEIFGPVFETLPRDSQCEKLDRATAFVKDGLATVIGFDKRSLYRAKTAAYRNTQIQSDILKEQREEKRTVLITNLRAFHVKICALYAPLLAERPLVVDADYVYNPDFAYLDQINQILVLLTVICHVVIGLSTFQCDFLLGVATLCIKLGMSTIGSSDGDISHSFSPSQNRIISNMPTSLSAALNKFGVDGRFDLYAACPACNYTHRACPVLGPDLYKYPSLCENQIVGKQGRSPCGAELLKSRKDGTLQPIKPYLVNSLPDYIARSLSDKEYLQQSLDATDHALRAIQTGEEQVGAQNVFDANFIKDFKGPDGQLFVDRGDKIRLAFSMHMDFFNPNGITQRGAHESLGIISCANLALDPSIRYSDNLFIASIIPGPDEPAADDIDHFVRPVIEQFRQAWRPGLKVSRTATSDSEVGVEAGILLSVNDLPAARKIAGFQGISSTFICTCCGLRGKTGVFNTNHSQWVPRDKNELRGWATAYRDAQTLEQQNSIFEKYGIRWSSFWLLDYWDPTQMLVIDAMHCILEGIVHYHCRHVLRLDGSQRHTSADGPKYALDWPWIPYDPRFTPDHLKLELKHIPKVAKVQDALCWAIEGDQSLTLDELWSRLDSRSTVGSLHFVAYTLGLSPTLDNIDPAISSLYMKRTKRKSRNNSEGIRFPTGKLAFQKNHFIALLLDWRLKQPRNSSAFILQTGKPEILSHIQKVIRATVTPSWLDSVPKNFGDAKAGSIKASEWQILSTVYLPIALITLWGDADGSAPADDDSELGFLVKALDHTMALFQATRLACRHFMTASRASAYRKYHTIWVDGLRTLFPHTREGRMRPNIHAAGHIYDFLLLFGPVMSWWCFPFERLIGTLQKINTNHHIGGEMEATIIRTATREANIRRWLRRPECPMAVKAFKNLFDRCFFSVNAGNEGDELRPMKGPQRAYAKFDGVNFSPSRTHAGNATVIYRPSQNQRPIGGQIQRIENTGPQTVRVHVRPYQPLPKSLYDPFIRYPHLSATTYSSTLEEGVDVVSLDDVIAHAARFDYSHNRTVLVNLSRD